MSRTPSPVARPGDGPTRSFGILSSFPPTACGIATFSAALAAGCSPTAAPSTSCAAAARAGDGGSAGPGRAGRRLAGRLAAAVDVLNRTDVAIVQHEYGIYGGADGDDVLAVLDALVVPSIVVAHTVVRHPTPHQRDVLERVCDAADAVVVMTDSARARLLEGFDVDAAKVIVIPHGAATPLTDSPCGRRRAGRPAARLLTWGLLGPGKGIEWAIDAVAASATCDPARPTWSPAPPTRRSPPTPARRTGRC